MVELVKLVELSLGSRSSSQTSISSSLINTHIPLSQSESCLLMPSSMDNSKIWCDVSQVLTNSADNDETTIIDWVRTAAQFISVLLQWWGPILVWLLDNNQLYIQLQYMYVCTCMYMYVHVCMYMYVCTCMYVHVCVTNYHFCEEFIRRINKSRPILNMKMNINVF